MTKYLEKKVYYIYANAQVEYDNDDPKTMDLYTTQLMYKQLCRHYVRRKNVQTFFSHTLGYTFFHK